MRPWTQTHGLMLGALVLLANATFASAQTAPTAKLNATDETRDLNIRAYVELLRSDLRTQKIAIVTEMMALSEDEDAKFWPIYRDYETQLSTINDDRIKGIKEYSETFDKMTDDIADRLARGSLGLEERRHALKADVYNKLKASLSSRTAARFLQVENQILLLLDLQIASSLPIIE
jgi:hypothetical protein